MTDLKTQLSDSERLSSVVLNQLHEQVYISITKFHFKHSSRQIEKKILLEKVF